MERSYNISEVGHIFPIPLLDGFKFSVRRLFLSKTEAEAEGGSSSGSIRMVLFELPRRKNFFKETTEFVSNLGDDSNGAPLHFESSLRLFRDINMLAKSGLCEKSVCQQFPSSRAIAIPAEYEGLLAMMAEREGRWPSRATCCKCWSRVMP